MKFETYVKHSFERLLPNPPNPISNLLLSKSDVKILKLYAVKKVGLKNI